MIGGLPIRRRSALAAVLVGLLATGQSSYGQASQPALRVGTEVRVAGSEDGLWLAVVGAKDSRLFYRTRLTPFDEGRRHRGRIAFMVSVADGAYVFSEDGSIYRYFAADPKPRPEAVLPDGQLPLSAVASNGGFYAVVPTSALRPLATRPAAADMTAASRPFKPGDAALSVARYDGQQWLAIAPCPASLTAAAATDELDPRLFLYGGSLGLLSAPAGGDSVELQWLDAPSRLWSQPTTIPAKGLTAFWVVRLNDTPTLVIVTSKAGAESIAVYRWLPTEDDAAAWAWRLVTDLRTLPPADGVAVSRYRAAVGFNQQLALLVSGSDGAGYLQFARPAAEPTEPPIPIQRVLAGPQMNLRNSGAWRMFTLVALVGIFMALFLLRRQSLVHTLELPKDMRVAAAWQRLLAMAIDVFPFGMAAAIVLEIDGWQALRRVAELAIGTQEELPPMRVLAWWGLTAGGHTLYALIMELLTRRTVGKVLCGIRVFPESGERASAVQVLTRNGFRFVEMLPPFWILAFLVVLSRNRQRLGDIFARTVVLRRAAEDAEGGESSASGGGDAAGK